VSALSRINRRRATSALAAWSLLVWTSRIRNIWTDDALTTSGQVGRTALALSFTVLAVAALVTVLRPVSRRASTLVVDVLAGWTVAVWAVRVPGIMLNDHEVAFVVVHVVLAVVSVALAALAVAEAHRAAAPSDTRAEPLAPTTSA
jgi:hypothetical protein